MGSISYYYNYGTLVAKWSEDDPNLVNGSNNVGEEIYLGKVINKEKNIFWLEEKGFYCFDLDTKAISIPNQEDLPLPIDTETETQNDNLLEKIDFGDSYFLQQLIYGINYNVLIDKLTDSDKDTLYALIFYYTLGNRMLGTIDEWYQNNFIKYLYPKANLSQTNITSLLSTIGEKKDKFLRAHLKFISESARSGFNILIDFPLTDYGYKNHKFDFDCRFITVLDKSSGFPLYYKLDKNNSFNLEQLIDLYNLFNLNNSNIDCCMSNFDDSCNLQTYSSPRINFLYKVDPNSRLFKEVIATYLQKVYHKNCIVNIGHCYAHVYKEIYKIIVDCVTGKGKNCFIYVCKQIKNNDNSDFIPAKKLLSMDQNQFLSTVQKMGLFVFVSSLNLDKDKIISAFLSYKQMTQLYANQKYNIDFLNVDNYDQSMIESNFLLMFISNFLLSLLRNRMNLVIYKHLVIPQQYKLLDCIAKNNKLMHGLDIVMRSNKFFDPLREKYIENPVLLLRLMSEVKANVYNNVITPFNLEANKYYNLFGLSIPTSVTRNGVNLIYEYSVTPEQFIKPYAFLYTQNKTSMNIFSATDYAPETPRKSRKTTKSTDKPKDDSVKRRGRPPKNKPVDTQVTQSEESGNTTVSIQPSTDVSTAETAIAEEKFSLENTKVVDVSTNNVISEQVIPAQDTVSTLNDTKISTQEQVGINKITPDQDNKPSAEQQIKQLPMDKDVVSQVTLQNEEQHATSVQEQAVEPAAVDTKVVVENQNIEKQQIEFSNEEVHRNRRVSKVKKLSVQKRAKLEYLNSLMHKPNTKNQKSKYRLRKAVQHKNINDDNE